MAATKQEFTIIYNEVHCVLDNVTGPVQVRN